jgi:hypothetical protein
LLVSFDHGDAVAVLHKIVGHVQESELRTDEHNARLRQERGAKAPDAHHSPGERSWIYKTADAKSGDGTMPDGDGEFTAVGWDETYLLVSNMVIVVCHRSLQTFPLALFHPSCIHHPQAKVEL